jgi:hypothetical protein
VDPFAELAARVTDVRALVVISGRHVSGIADVRGGRIVPVTDSLLEALVAEELGAVVFVMDYLQLDFGNARFTAYVWPTVTIGDVTREFGDRGYRDALCALITHEVTSTEESPGAGLVIRFGLGEIVTNPEPTDLAGPEIAMLQVHEDAFREASWAVWLPGEHVFAGRDLT